MGGVGNVAVPTFRVVCYEAGEWDLAKARVVEAQDAQEAAERVCGRPLLSGGNIGQLRAQVAPISRPRSKRTFYAPALGFVTADQASTTTQPDEISSPADAPGKTSNAGGGSEPTPVGTHLGEPADAHRAPS